MRLLTALRGDSDHSSHYGLLDWQQFCRGADKKSTGAPDRPSGGGRSTRASDVNAILIPLTSGHVLGRASLRGLHLRAANHGDTIGGDANDDAPALQPGRK